MKNPCVEKVNTHRGAATAGVTLVEVITVLLILGILAAISIPSFAGYLREVQRQTAISECSVAVESARALCDEGKVDGTPRSAISESRILGNSGLDGEVTFRQIDAGKTLLHLTYLKSDVYVTWCSHPGDCEYGHKEEYNFEKMEGAERDPGEDPEEPQPPDPDDPYIMVIDDFELNTHGPWDDFVFNLYGSHISDHTVPNPDYPYSGIFYHEGSYYYLDKDNQFFKNANKDADFIKNAVKINNDKGVVTPGPNIHEGDVIMQTVGNRNYFFIFCPYPQGATPPFTNTWTNPGWWFCLNAKDVRPTFPKK